MQAIQTVYKGCKFRSRLEARWAVFLDSLSVNWSYENEGYNLNGIWYLPDFFVSDWDCWIEIKGINPSEDESNKCQLLAELSGKKVLLISGEPWVENSKNHYNISFYDTTKWKDQSGSSGWEFGEGRRCSEEIWLMNDMNAFALRAIPHQGDHKFPLSGTFATSIVNALSTARQARFEHGETP